MTQQAQGMAVKTKASFIGERTNAECAAELDRLAVERDEALARERALTEVLHVINSSPGDLAPVFDALLEKAMTLCEATFGALYTYDGEAFTGLKYRGISPELAQSLRAHPTRPYPGGPPARLVDGAVAVQIADLRETEGYRAGVYSARQLVDVGGARTVLVVALRIDKELLGYIGFHRQEVRLFTDQQIALLQSFAAQAVIAMENARLLTETREALEQQTATAEVLQIINSSPGDLTPVWDAMLEKALGLCEANFGLLCSFDGEAQILLASRGMSPELVEMARRVPIEPTSSVGRLARSKDHFIHTPDITDDPVYRSGVPSRRLFVETTGARTALWVALRKDGVLIGVFIIYRTDVRPFSDKQIALLRSFAAQAVIAMENARLLTATREALEQQTATAEVLQVINSSPGDLQPVFDAMLEKATRLCDAELGALLRFDGEAFHLVTVLGYSAAGIEALREPLRPEGSNVLERLVKGENIVQVADVADSEEYRAGVRGRRILVDLFGARTAIWVALRGDEALFGYFCIYRKEVRRFTDKQIALLQNFAAQAVIAMENTRLLAETREALEAQQATAEVMQVINASSGDLAPVFQAMLDKAMALCGAGIGGLGTWQGERFSFVAALGVSKPFTEFIANNEVSPGPRSGFLQIARGKGYVQFEDIATSPFYAAGDPLSRALVDLDGGHTTLCVPLVRDEDVLGVITAVRREVRPFSERQIALLKNFAGQAVVAMANARLITETREALEQQTATAEILQVINSSPGDLAPVFNSMLDKAMALCGAAFGILAIYDGECFQTVAGRGLAPAYAEFLRQPVRPTAGNGAFRVVHGEEVVHIADLREDAATRSGDAARRAVIETGGARTQLIVSLRKEETLLGMFIIYRQEVRPFTDKQIALLQNFAAQAVIAMENARLITETREALEQQTATAEVLGVINSSPRDLVPVFEAMLEKAARLCEAETAHLMRFDGANFSRAASRGEPPGFDQIMPIGQPLPHIVTKASVPFRMIAARKTIHVLDMRGDESVRAGAPAETRAAEEGIRTVLFVPLLREGEVLGCFVMHRMEVRAFTDKQIALVENFAAQAVIAMENARLLTETREALEQQTATAEVLAGHQFLARRSRAGVRRDARKGGTSLRSRYRAFVPLREQRLLPVGEPRRIGRFRRAFPARSADAAGPEFRAGTDDRHPVGRACPGCARGRILSAAPLPRRGRRGRGRDSDGSVRPVDQRGRGRRPFHDAPHGGEAFFRQADRPPAEFRGAGGDCDRERAADHRNARGPGAADRDGRGVGGHQLLARRSRAGVRGDPR